MIFELLSALNADIGEDKCGTVMVEIAFLICAMLMKSCFTRNAVFIYCNIPYAKDA